MDYEKIISNEITRIQNGIAEGTIVANASWDLENTFESFLSPYYLLVLTINGTVSSVLHIVVWYIILFETPKEMHDYRVFLLNISICSFLHDVLISAFWRPVPLFPNLIGTTTGFIRVLGPKSGSYGMIISISLIAFYVMSIVNGFIFRLFTLLDIRYYRMLMSKCGYSILAIIQCVPSIVLGTLLSFADVPVHNLQHQVLQIYPQLAPLFDSESVFGYDPNSNKWIVFFFICTTTLVSTVIPVTQFLCSAVTLRKLNEMRNRISDQTYKLHKNLITVLIIQITLPNVMILLPSGVVVVAAWLRLPYNNIFAEGTLMLCSFHSVIDNLVMLIAITPYRIALKDIIFRRWRKVKTTDGLNNEAPRLSVQYRTTFQKLSIIPQNYKKRNSLNIAL